MKKILFLTIVVFIIQGCVGMPQYHTGAVLQPGKVNVKLGDVKMYTSTAGALASTMPRISLSVGFEGDNEIGLHYLYPMEYQIDLWHQFAKQEKTGFNLSGDIGYVNSFGNYLKTGVNVGRKMGGLEPYVGVQRYTFYGEKFTDQKNDFSDFADWALNNSSTSFIVGTGVYITDNFKIIPEWEYKMIDNKGKMTTLTLGLSLDF